MSPTLEDQERHLLVKVIDRILYKLDDLVRPYVHKVGLLAYQVTHSHCHTITHSQHHTLTSLHCHSLTHSHPHTVTPSHTHIPTLSHHHSLTLSHTHIPTPSHCHTITSPHPTRFLWLLNHCSLMRITMLELKAARSSPTWRRQLVWLP